MSANTARKSWDMETKRRVVEALLARRTSIEDACREYDLQPYQVMAWVGQVQLAQPSSGATGTFKALSQAELHVNGAMIEDPDLAKIIGDWYIRTQLLPKFIPPAK